MKIDNIKDRKEWDDFLVENEGSFLQSNAWSNFKKNYQKIFQIEARKENKLKGVCQILEERSAFGNYFYIPYGPFGKEEEVRKKLFLSAQELARKNKAIFLRAEPIEEIGIGKKPNRRVQPQKTIINDLSKTEEELLSDFSSNTRYNIRLAEKKGVTVSEDNDIDSFFSLIEKTKKRQNFSSYKKDYFRLLLENTSSSIYLAKKDGDVVAANIVLYFGKTASCLHSGSDYKKRDLKAANLLRFESFKKAKERGCLRFDSWGIDEKRFPGVTRFKKGFRGREIVYPEGEDLPIKSLNYFTYRFVTEIFDRVKKED